MTPTRPVPDLHVVRVFCGPDGQGGNPLGVVRDGAAVPDQAARQALAAELGFSETVFIDDAGSGRLDIHTPGVRLPFAGHPLVGTAWLLRRLGRPVDTLRPPAGAVPVTYDGEDMVWVRGRPEWSAGRRTEEYATPADVDALDGPPPGEGPLYVWAWRDRAAGTVRARYFPRRGDGIVEDEATGAAALTLSHELGRALDIRQGTGSRIRTRPYPDGTIALGGSVRPVPPRP
ncbi:PhzF family phenazine biosynthesis protein [Streptomyces albofaciens JCM 4342]|uniref:PhzF family phenazine biosynthesis protein n=1 Tax=Streptomyces albofaciens TaxID=66866 RepID=UPI00123C55B4|nr:PhzF family phenazine biosynthesis protein [Streptomyces albofaciens]KAA6222242.1 PhzF family phenazine biosynthesis protein [Streptomyces albofaciens JCM 4342]